MIDTTQFFGPAAPEPGDGGDAAAERSQALFGDMLAGMLGLEASQFVTQVGRHAGRQHGEDEGQHGQQRGTAQEPTATPGIRGNHNPWQPVTGFTVTPSPNAAAAADRAARAQSAEGAAAAPAPVPGGASLDPAVAPVETSPMAIGPEMASDAAAVSTEAGSDAHRAVTAGADVDALPRTHGQAGGLDAADSAADPSAATAAQRPGVTRTHLSAIDASRIARRASDVLRTSAGFAEDQQAMRSKLRTAQTQAAPQPRFDPETDTTSLQPAANRNAGGSDETPVVQTTPPTAGTTERAADPAPRAGSAEPGPIDSATSTGSQSGAAGPAIETAMDSATARPSISRPAAPPQLLERVVQTIQQLQSEPPPNSMIVEIPDLEGVRVRVAILQDGTVHLGLVGDRAGEGPSPLLSAVREALTEQGFDLEREAPRQGDPRDPDDRRRPRAPKRPIQAYDDALRM